ncbi:hypothetical protein GDO78_007735 [Eleutherodactylus coqui]|uniref:Uncharacterized protein n=1 Tax=Eleutherodactylus coqui TaxID=57060 RepID=A0A8J6KDX0_ELECQ|nr:hypothetical protein GDO78_007735 [Eleutherodactylus coqui]
MRNLLFSLHNYMESETCVLLVETLTHACDKKCLPKQKNMERGTSQRCLWRVMYCISSSEEEGEHGQHSGQELPLYGHECDCLFLLKAPTFLRLTILCKPSS